MPAYVFENELADEDDLQINKYRNGSENHGKSKKYAVTVGF